MDRRHILRLSAITVLGLSLLPGGALAQQKSVKEQLVGTWTVVSWDQINKDGSKFQRFGANPKGVNVFDADGRFYIMFARPDLPKFAASNPMKTTPEENRAVMEGSIAYFGTYTVDEAGKSISLRVDASTFPNQVGVEQKRDITSLTSNNLQLSNPNASAGGQINYVMKRATTVARN